MFFIILTCIVIFLFTGFYYKSNEDSDEGYFLCNRSLSIGSLTLTLLATQLGGGALIGASESAFAYGWKVIVYPLGMGLGLMAIGFTGYGQRLRALNLMTISELFLIKYQSRKLQVCSSLMSILALFLILIAQAIAVKTLFNGLGLSTAIFVFVWLSLVLYTVMGGLGSVVKTDIQQSCIMLFILATLFISAYWGVKADPILKTLNNLSDSTREVPIFSWLMMPLLFMFIEQDIAQRCFSAKNSNDVKTASILSGLLIIIASCVAIYFGLQLRSLGYTESGASIFLRATEQLCPQLIAKMGSIVILLAVLSTADSLLCSISSNIVCDRLISKQSTKYFGMSFSKVTTAMLGIASLGIAMGSFQVLPLMIFAYELSVCVFFIPIILAVYGYGLSEKDCWIQILLSAVVYITGYNPLYEYVTLPCFVLGINMFVAVALFKMQSIRDSRYCSNI